MSLKSLLAGAVVLSMFNINMHFSSPLHAQNTRYSKTLEQKLKDRRISEKERKTHIALYGIMHDAKRKKGISINAGYHPSTLIEGKEIFLHLKPEYLRSPRGASGALRILIYLGEESWYGPMGIDNFTLSLYSLKETRLSKKIYEVNVNYYAGCVTNMAAKEVLFEADMLNKKLGAGFYTVLKKIKITKKNVNDVLFGKKLLEDLLEYQKKQRRNQIAVEKLHDHVCETNIHYKGHGFIESGEKLEYKLRCPKLVEIIIEQGEESIRGFHLEATLRYYVEHALGTQRIRKKHIKYFAPMNMKEFAKTLKIKPEKQEKDETDEDDEEN